MLQTLIHSYSIHLILLQYETLMLFFQDFLALLAYEEPEKSPMFHLLSMDYRQQVADSLNRAILGLLAESLSLSLLLFF